MEWRYSAWPFAASSSLAGAVWCLGVPLALMRWVKSFSQEDSRRSATTMRISEAMRVRTFSSQHARRIHGCCGAALWQCTMAVLAPLMPQFELAAQQW